MAGTGLDCLESRIWPLSYDRVAPALHCSVRGFDPTYEITTRGKREESLLGGGVQYYGLISPASGKASVDGHCSRRVG